MKDDTEKYNNFKAEHDKLMDDYNKAVKDSKDLKDKLAKCEEDKKKQPEAAASNEKLLKKNYDNLKSTSDDEIERLKNELSDLKYTFEGPNELLSTSPTLALER